MGQKRYTSLHPDLAPVCMTPAANMDNSNHLSEKSVTSSHPDLAPVCMTPTANKGQQSGLHFSLDVLLSWANPGSCAHKCVCEIFRTVTRNAVNNSACRKKRLFLISLKQTCIEYLYLSTVLWEPEHGSPRTRAWFSENQSPHKLENRKTSPCSPRAPNLLYVLPCSWMVGWNKLCSPVPNVCQVR